MRHMQFNECSEVKNISLVVGLIRSATKIREATTTAR